MHHEVLVGVLHRAAHLLKERQPLLGPEPMLVAVGDERPAGDVLHHQVRPPVFAHPSIVEPRDSRVLQRGEDLPLDPEAVQHLVGVHPALDQLDRDPLLEDLVRPLGQVDRSHSAAADFFDDPVRAEPPDRRGLLAPGVQQRDGEGGDRVAQHQLRFGAAVE